VFISGLSSYANAAVSAYKCVYVGINTPFDLRRDKWQIPRLVYSVTIVTMRARTATHLAVCVYVL